MYVGCLRFFYSRSDCKVFLAQTRISCKIIIDCNALNQVGGNSTMYCRHGHVMPLYKSSMIWLDVETLQGLSQTARPSIICEGQDQDSLAACCAK